jgi:translocator protein
MPRDVVRQVVNVLAYLATIVGNALSVTLPLGVATTEQIANRYPIYFLPANFTFGVWGVIYLALGVFTVYQALPSQRENPVLRRIGYLFALTCVCNVTWLVLFQYEFFAASMLPMVVLLLTLITIYLRLGVGPQRVSTATRLCIWLPFSLYLGWITVATIANATYVLYDLRWNGFGISGATWAIVLIVVAALLTTVMVLTRRDLAYMLVVVWALAGIAVKQASTSSVSTTAWVLAGALLLLGLGALIGSTRNSGGNSQGRAAAA